MASPAVERLLRERLAALPGLEEGTTRFGNGSGAAWRVGGREVAHLHAPDRIDVRVPRGDQRDLYDDPRASFRPRTSDWVELTVEAPEDVDLVCALVRRAARAAEGGASGGAGAG
jgi:hypothetical protein